LSDRVLHPAVAPKAFLLGPRTARASVYDVRVLLLLAHFGKERQEDPGMPQISQETLAEMIGTTRSRVHFFLNKFRRLGFIDYNGGLRVHSALLNVLLHD
jgi:hypothetical protein